MDCELMQGAACRRLCWDPSWPGQEGQASECFRDWEPETPWQEHNGGEIIISSISLVHKVFIVHNDIVLLAIVLISDNNGLASTDLHDNFSDHIFDLAFIDSFFTLLTRFTMAAGFGGR